MGNICFQRVAYDSLAISKLTSYGYRVNKIPTDKIVDLVSDKSIGVRMAIFAYGKYHLLTGCLEKEQSMHEFIVIDQVILNKAKIKGAVHSERTAVEHKKADAAATAGRGFQSFKMK